MAVEARRLERGPAERLASGLRDPRVLPAVLEGALESKRRGKGSVVSVSKNVFIPLTNLCRDRCAYCTFAVQPDSPEAKTYSLDEVAEAVRDGVRAGCTEALFCLGDKPELAYLAHRQWLATRGLRTTAEYLVEACRVGFENGMLPHTNAGILRRRGDDRAAAAGTLRWASCWRARASGCAARGWRTTTRATRIRRCACACTRRRAQLKIPFTSGILLGIGENDAERVDTLLAIRDLADRYGHIQEVIVQPFHPKPDTPMRDTARSAMRRSRAGWRWPGSCSGRT